MALVSPGIQISINDQSQFVSNAVGSVPLVVLATAQDKLYNGALASGTTKANAGKLQSFTSQRDLVTAMGTPTFQVSAAGTPEHAGERNEYGLMAAYSALGLGNQLYAIRADIDLDQLVGTSVRPFSNPVNGQYWLDLANTEWGIFALDRADDTFTGITPSNTETPLLYITDADQVVNDTANYPSFDVPKPKQSIGSIGSYALVFVDTDGTNSYAARLWKKTGTDSVSLANGGPGSNQWVEVGSPSWQLSIPAVTGTVANPTITAGTTLTINGQTITATGTTVSSLVADINTAGITGIKAANVANRLAIFATSSADSGRATVASGTMNVLTVLGITANSYYAPILFYGTYAERPSNGWFTTDTNPRPSGSIWWKIGSTGGGLNLAFKRFNSATGSWASLTVPAYTTLSQAIFGLDPLGGGVNIAQGQVIAAYVPTDTTYNALRLLDYRDTIVSEGNSGSIGMAAVFPSGGTTQGDAFTIRATQPGTDALTAVQTITLSGTTAESFVTDVLSAGIPYVTAYIDNGSIHIAHQTDGLIQLVETVGTPLADAGFVVDANGSATGGGLGYAKNIYTGAYAISNFTTAVFAGTNLQYSESSPYGAPEDGTFWYYSNAAEVDIMINDNGWKGYRNVSADIRGFNLTNTDPAGVIVSPTEPTSQTDSTSLVAGDIWLDSGDLANYPALYRYNGNEWTAIDNTDHVSSDGIIFADARWSADGSTDIVTGTIPTIASLLDSNYIDLDCPDYRLYPRGALLFNTRRSGYNVKKFVKNYYTANNTNIGLTGLGYPATLPTVTDAWVTASGLDNRGVVKSGANAQRSLIVAAMQAAIDSNVEIREDSYQINLLCAPGYPELIDNLINLNTDRGETGFVIGDTPMTLPAVATDITRWNNNTDGNGLATASPYLGVYYPAGLTSDLSGNTVAVPASHMVLRTFIYNDNVSYQWFAPAGTRRGLVSNVSDIGYVDAETGSWVHNSITQGLRDSLYVQSINPITQLPGVGIVVWGQETKSGTSTSRNRVNVVRLENYLRTVFKSIANGYLFEPNDQITRKSIASQIEAALNDVLGKRGVYDFLVVCDSTNNPPSAIANNQLYVDVAIEPSRDVEFIYIPIALYNPGALANLGTSST